MKKGLHGNWYVGMYKAKSHMKKNYNITHMMHPDLRMVCGVTLAVQFFRISQIPDMIYSEETTAKIAHNTVNLEKSFLMLPIE